MNVSETESVATEVEQQSAEIDLLDLALVLARHKRDIMRSTVAVAVLAAVISFILPTRYTATARIMPPQQSGSLASALMGQLGALGSLAGMAGKDIGLKNPSDMYIGMLKSRTIEDTLVQRFDLLHVYNVGRMSDARQKLEGNSDIVSGKDSLIKISVEDKDKKRAAEMANAYIDELRAMSQRLAVTEAAQRRVFFEQQLSQAKDDLSRAEVALKETQQRTGVIELTSQARATVESVATIRALIASREVQLRAMQSFATDQNPDVVRVQQELSGLRAQLTKLEQQQNAGNGDIAVPTAKVPDAALEYVRRLREVKYQEVLFEALAKQYEIAKLDEAKDPAFIQVVDQAVEPDRRSSPMRSIIILCGIFAGFIGSILFCFLSEGLKRSASEPKNAERLQQLRETLGSGSWKLARDKRAQ